MSEAPDPFRRRLIALLALSLAGIVIAAILAWEHLHPFDLPGCSKGGFFDCGTVNASCWSEVRGIPIAVFGVLQYALVGGLAAARVGGGPRAAGPARALFALTLWGVLVSIFMLAVSETQVHALCLYCVTLYLLSAIALGLAWGIAGPPAGALRELFSTTNARFVLVALVGVVVLAIASPRTVFTCPVVGAAPTPTASLGDPGEQARQLILHAPRMDPGPGEAYCKGPADAPLVIVEFGDLECPVCRMVSWTVDPWVDSHPNDVRFCFRHWPIDLGCNPDVHFKKHEHACDSAWAAEAAGIQGKFWDYHDLLYAQADEHGAPIPLEGVDLTHAALLARAKRLGLDTAQFEKDMADPAVKDKVASDLAVGSQMGVDSTPTFFVNGRKVGAIRDVKTLDTWLQMAKKGELSPAASPTL